MTDEQYRERILAIEAWANRLVDALGGAPPTSSAPTVDEQIRAAVAGMARRQRHAAEIAEIEKAMEFLTTIVEARYYGEPDPPAPSARAAAALAQFEKEWA